MTASDMVAGIDQYLLKRLMPVEGAIPNVPGIEMYGCSVPAGMVGGDLFEYINFQQRYDIEARIERAHRLSAEALDGRWPQDWLEWLHKRPDYKPEVEAAFRQAASLQQTRVAENLETLRSTAGLLLVDAQGHGIISAKIASTVHDTFHALMLSELDHHGETTPELFEQINIRLAHSVTARNALGSELGSAREIATMLYGEIRPSGHFRFVNFGHPPPLIFSADRGTFVAADGEQMTHFPPLGLEVPEDHPDRNRYSSISFRQHEAGYSDVSDIALIRPGDLLFLYTDGVYDGSDDEVRRTLEDLLRENCERSAKEICRSVIAFAGQRERTLQDDSVADEVDDKTVFVIKREA